MNRGLICVETGVAIMKHQAAQSLVPFKRVYRGDIERREKKTEATILGFRVQGLAFRAATARSAALSHAICDSFVRAGIGRRQQGFPPHSL